MARRIGFGILAVAGIGLVVAGILAQEPEVIYRFASQI